jgi:hypothetical protein
MQGGTSCINIFIRRYTRYIFNVKSPKKITIIVFIEIYLKSIFWHAIKTNADQMAVSVIMVGLIEDIE